LNETAITAGSDGFLCLWHDKGIIKKQSAHPKAAILSLFTSKNSKIFVSGAVDGKAIVWQHSSNSIIQKVF
jgi:WD40 repeat protein